MFTIQEVFGRDFAKFGNIGLPEFTKRTGCFTCKLPPGCQSLEKADSPTKGRALTIGPDGLKIE